MCYCDANYVTFLDTGAYTKNSDSCIFQNSVLRNKISGNEFNIPDHSPLTGDSDNILPHVSVGDKAFGLSTHMMRLYSGKQLSVEKNST